MKLQKCGKAGKTESFVHSNKEVGYKNGKKREKLRNLLRQQHKDKRN